MGMTRKTCALTWGCGFDHIVRNKVTSFGYVACSDRSWGLRREAKTVGLRYQTHCYWASADQNRGLRRRMQLNRQRFGSLYPSSASLPVWHAC